MTRDRGQLVLAAAAVVAFALAPVAIASLQLGYHGDVRANGGYDAPARNAERVLSRAVHEGSAGVTGEYAWDDRSEAVDAVRSRLGDDVAALRSARVESGTVYAVRYDESAASAWANRNCPGGPNRQFGDCEAARGVVVQDRAGETHVLAVSFDVRVTDERGTAELTLIIESVR